MSPVRVHQTTKRALAILGRSRMVVLLLTMGLAPPLQAQAVRGQLTDEDTGGPIPGAMIIMLDAAGQQRAAALTDQRGIYQLRVPSAGDYTLRVLRIGYESWESEAFHLTGGQAKAFPIAMPLRAIQLAALEVEAEADSRCWGRPEDGPLLATIWGEVQKALTATQWTPGQRLYRYTTRTYTRELNATGSRVLREQSNTRTATFITPFMSRPPHELSERGYFEIGRQESLYFAPDANALLSDDFVEDHCFSTKRRAEDDRQLIGLAFEPTPDRFEPEVEGVLWLDRETAELRRLEYHYVNFPLEFKGKDRLRGQLEFERLPSGAWVIRDWHIRMPIFGLRPSISEGEPEMVLRGLTEAGGEITEIVSPSGERVFRAPVATLTGSIFESDAGLALADATVRIQGTEYGTVADEDGRFTLDAPMRGTYTVEVRHPRVDSLGVSISASAQLIPGSLTTLRLTAPPLSSAMTQLCGAEPIGSVERVLFGTVTNATSGAPVAGATVTLHWDQSVVQGRLMRRDSRDAVATTDDRGRYVVCGIQGPVDVFLFAQHEDRESRIVIAKLGDRVVELDGVAFEATRSIWQFDVELLGVDAFTGSVAGSVVAEETGVPIVGATVSVAGSASPVITDPAGAFRVSGLAPGRHLIQVRSLGYAPTDRSVVLEPDQALTLDDTAFVLSANPVELEGVVASASAGRRDLADFHERRRGGLGSFAQRDEIEEWSPRAATDVLRRMPGIRVRRNPNYGKPMPAVVSALGLVVEEEGAGPDTRRWLVESTRASAGRGACPILFFVDGIFIGSGFDVDIDAVITTSELEAVEAYFGIAQIPQRYARSGSSCGAIAFWTR